MIGHHILYEKSQWSCQENARRLRRTPELIPKMDNDVEIELHRNITAVPILPDCIAGLVLANFEPVRGDTLKSVDNLLFSLARVALHYRDRELEHKMVELTMLGVDLQRPYVREGMIGV